ncbi:MAG TPA: hypothetical protein VM118_05375 [Acidobacteriota bacterium]|nr:hypothetical protein [Acidobacteriota bacterium]
MAFTSPELVRTHLGDVRLAETTVDDAAVVLNGTEPSQLYHTGLVEGSVTVKGRRAADPICETVTLADNWVALTHAHIVPATVLVAGDSSLGTVYVENIDFTVDYRGGRLRRVTGGSIASGQTVVTWYEPYFIYGEGDDFDVDYPAGSLTRISTGAIADGQMVAVDYTVALGAVPDGVIERAITEAEEAVLSLIDASHHDEPAAGIVIGETHWAVAAVCRMRAASALADTGVPSSAARAAAQTWLELASQYDHSGRDRLARYATPVAPLRTGRSN